MDLFATILDPKIKGNLPRYLLQCSIATVVLLVILSVEHTMARAVVIAAIGSTAFVLFIMPQSDAASPRHVLGGHFIALVVGSLAALFDAEAAFLLALEGSLAVGVSIFIMAATNTEHAPAAGTALGVVMHGFDWRIVVLLVGSVVAMVVIHQALRPWLRDLY